MAIQPVSSINIFFCSAPEDSILQAELEAHLGSFRQIKQIAMWSDRDIPAGASRDQQIEAYLDAAHIILILVSADFLNSDYWYNIAMERALQRHQIKQTTLLPILLRPVHWEDTPLRMLPVLPTDKKAVTLWENRDEAWSRVVESIRAEVRALIPTQLLSHKEIAILYPEMNQAKFPPPREAPSRPRPSPALQPGQQISDPVMPLPHPSSFSPHTVHSPILQSPAVDPQGESPYKSQASILPVVVDTSSPNGLQPLPVQPPSPKAQLEPARTPSFPTPTPFPLRPSAKAAVKFPNFGVPLHFMQLGLVGLMIVALASGIFWLTLHRTSSTASTHPSPTVGVHVSPTKTMSPSLPKSITEFPTSSNALSGITAGPDGNLWFTEYNTDSNSNISESKIGRITPNGTITEFPLPNGVSGPTDITTGPDRNLWFTEYSIQIGRITPSGRITEFPLPQAPALFGITVGPDGNLWFTADETNGPPDDTHTDEIGRITPNGTITEFPLPDLNKYGGVSDLEITAGADGNLWFIDDIGATGKIGRITPSGRITEFPLPTPDGGPSGITAKPDGNLWFTEFLARKIGRITPDGRIIEFPLPNGASQPDQITTGPDGNLWFTEKFDGKIGRITPDGRITEFPLPNGASQPQDITTGPDGNLWFTENLDGTGKIGRINIWQLT